MSAAIPLPEEFVDEPLAGAAESEPLLEVRGLKTHFDTRQGVVKAVDQVDFHVDRGEVLGLVGESGCGKSVTSFSIMGLIAHPGAIVAGEIIFHGQDLTKLKKDEIRKLRGEHISMIFQQPASALNPVYRAGAQIKEVFELHRDWTKDVEEEKVIEMLTQVGIPDPKRRAAAYPHELSGGMAQRIMIAMALACEPELLIADEPTTALDVTIQAQILDLMRELQKSTNTAVILITHDLGVVAEMADRIAVMYAGEIVEEADVRTIFRNPHAPVHPGSGRVDPGPGQAQVGSGHHPGRGSLAHRSSRCLPFCFALCRPDRTRPGDLHPTKARSAGNCGGAQSTLLALPG